MIIVVVFLSWLLGSVPAALLIGRAIRIGGGPQ